jgi:hypothetical protein
VLLLLPALFLPADGQSISERMGLPENPLPNFRPVTPSQRFRWFVRSTVGPGSLFLSGPLSAAWLTAFNLPPEYGPLGWRSETLRMRLTGIFYPPRAIRSWNWGLKFPCASLFAPCARSSRGRSIF